MRTLSFDATMRRGWIGLALCMLFLSLRQFLREDLHGATQITLVLCLIVNSGIVTYLIRQIRTGPRIDGMIADAVPLSGWGYVWRGFVAQIVATILLALVRAFVFPIEYARAAGYFNVTDLLFLEVPFLALTAVAIWLLFSQDKARQARWFVASIRGY